MPLSTTGPLALAALLALTASAAASSIRVDRARLGLAPGSAAIVEVSGVSGTLTVQPSFDGVDVSYDALKHRLAVTARTPGNGTIALSDTAGDSATIAVLVAPLAGTIPAAVDVELAGTVSAPFAAARIRDAIERGMQRAPGTGLDVHGITIPAALAPGSVLDALAGVTIAGRGAYVDVSGKTSVHVHVDAEPPLEPAVLWYSDDPEYVGAQADGVLFHATLDPAVPARLFAYHVAGGVPRRLALVLRAPAAARVQLLGTIGGPSPAFSYVGQQSSARYMAERASGESTVLDVAPGTPYELQLGVLQPGDLLETIADLRAIDGGPVDVALVASAPGEALPPLDGPEVEGDSHGRRGAFALNAVAPIALSLNAGDPEPPPVDVGDAMLPNLRPGGRPLGGDYGVVRPIVLHLGNAQAVPAIVYLYELTSGSGGATATFWFDGDGGATLVPCVDDAAQPRLIKAFALAGGASLTVTGTFMTDGASSYPIRFGLTTAVPAAPGGCAAAPAPAPSAQAGPPADQP